jgi:hypothetical protein
LKIPGHFLFKDGKQRWPEAVAKEDVDKVGQSADYSVLDMFSRSLDLLKSLREGISVATRIVKCVTFPTIIKRGNNNKNFLNKCQHPKMIRIKDTGIKL